MMRSREIEWIGNKAKIERSIIEEHGQNLLRDLNNLNKDFKLSYYQKLSLLQLYGKYCNADCFMDEFYSIQVNHILREEAKEELLNNRTTEIFISKRIKNE